MSLSSSSSSTSSQSSSASSSRTNSVTPTFSLHQTPTITRSSSATSTLTQISTVTASPAASQSLSNTQAPSASVSLSKSSSASFSSSQVASSSSSPSSTVSASSTPTVSQSSTPSQYLSSSGSQSASHSLTMSGSQLQSRSQTGSQSAASTPTSTQSPSFSSPPGAGVAFVTAFIKTGSGLDALTGGPLLPTLELAFASAGGAGAAMTTLSQLVDVASGETFARVSNGYYLPLGSRRQLATDSQGTQGWAVLVFYNLTTLAVDGTAPPPPSVALERVNQTFASPAAFNTTLGPSAFLVLLNPSSPTVGYWDAISLVPGSAKYGTSIPSLEALWVVQQRGPPSSSPAPSSIAASKPWVIGAAVGGSFAFLLFCCLLVLFFICCCRCCRERDQKQKKRPPAVERANATDVTVWWSQQSSPLVASSAVERSGTAGSSRYTTQQVGAPSGQLQAPHERGLYAGLVAGVGGGAARGSQTGRVTVGSDPGRRAPVYDAVGSHKSSSALFSASPRLPSLQKAPPHTSLTSGPVPSPRSQAAAAPAQAVSRNFQSLPPHERSARALAVERAVLLQTDDATSATAALRSPQRELSAHVGGDSRALRLQLSQQQPHMLGPI